MKDNKVSQKQAQVQKVQQTQQVDMDNLFVIQSPTVDYSNLPEGTTLIPKKVKVYELEQTRKLLKAGLQPFLTKARYRVTFSQLSFDSLLDEEDNLLVEEDKLYSYSDEYSMDFEFYFKDLKSKKINPLIYSDELEALILDRYTTSDSIIDVELVFLGTELPEEYFNYTIENETILVIR